MNTTRPAPAPAPMLLMAAVLAAAVGGGVAAVFGRSEPASPTAPAADPAVASRLAALEERLTALEQRPSPAVVTDGGLQRQQAAEPDVQRLNARLDALEQQIAQMQSKAAQPPLAPQPPAAPRPDDPQVMAQRLQGWQTTILDPRASEAQKLEAWSAMRHRPDSWNDAIVATMTSVGLHSADGETRANVWRQADGSSTSPAMGAALLQALQTDSYARAREEAAETLAKYLDVPGVRQALEAAARADQDEKVRRQAARSLAGSDER